MGIEGQNSPRDVASEETKHPWEVFPEDANAAKTGAKKRKELTPEQQAKREKRKAKVEKIKTWAKANKVLAAGICVASVAVVVGVAIGATFLIKTLTTKPEEEEQILAETAAYNGVLDDMTIVNAPTPEYAFAAVNKKVRPVLVEGIYGNGFINFTKFEDNYNVFEKTVSSESDKICYRLYMIYAMAAFYDENGTARAEVLMKKFDERKYDLNNTQRYFYLMAQIKIKTGKGETEELNNLLAQLDKEYPEDEGYYDVDTGQLITDPAELEKIKNKFENVEKEGENE